jgi:UDP-glucose 4-epimerase
MNILVTGGAGFIGSHIVDALIERGHSVSIYDDLSSGKQANINQKATLIQADIRDKENLERVFRENAFDAVYHLAAQIDVRKSAADPLADAETNILASLNLIHLAATHSVKRFIFSSTGGAIYGDTDLRPTNESHPEHPLSPYGIAKLAIDKYLHFYREIMGLSSVSLRYGNVYGPRQNPHGEAGVVAIFLNKMLGEEQPVINGDGTQSRDYVFVGDVIRANIAALETETASGIYNIGTGIETSVNELFSTLNTLFDNSFQEIHAQAKAGEQKTSSLDTTRAKNELNWEPTMSLADGLKLTFEWFKK